MINSQKTFYVPIFFTDSDGNYINAKVKIPFGNYDLGDPIKLRFDFVDEKIFMDGKEVATCPSQKTWTRTLWVKLLRFQVM